MQSVSTICVCTGFTDDSSFTSYTDDTDYTNGTGCTNGAKCTEHQCVQRIQRHQRNQRDQRNQRNQRNQRDHCRQPAYQPTTMFLHATGATRTVDATSKEDFYTPPLL